MNNHDLENPYRSTEEDVQFTIGQIQLRGAAPAPILQIYRRDGTREKLDVVREAAKDGLILVNGTSKGGKRDVSIGTGGQVACPRRICYIEGRFGSTSRPLRRGLGWPTA